MEATIHWRHTPYTIHWGHTPYTIHWAHIPYTIHSGHTPYTIHWRHTPQARDKRKHGPFVELEEFCVAGEWSVESRAAWVCLWG